MKLAQTIYAFETDGQGVCAYRKLANAISDRRDMLRDGWGCTDILRFEVKHAVSVYPKKRKGSHA